MEMTEDAQGWDGGSRELGPGLPDAQSPPPDWRKTRRIRRALAEAQREPLLPLAGIGAAWGEGVLVHALGLNPWLSAASAAAASGALGGAALLTVRESLGDALRRYATTALVYGSSWSAWTAAHGGGGVVNAVALAAGTALSLPWWLKHAATWTAGDEQPAGDDEPEACQLSELEQVWRQYCAPANKAAPGTRLKNVEDMLIGGVKRGERADIVLRRGEQQAADVIRRAGLIASACDRTATQVDVEPHPTGRESLARVTMLDVDMLAEPRDWERSTLDPATGIAAAGTFFDGLDCHVRFWIPGNGAVHWILAGNTGGGKTTFIFMLLATVTDPGNRVPVVPVLIDPEEGGQSLIAWQRKLTYSFIGEQEAIRALRGLDAVMGQRAREMAEEGLDYFEPTGERPLIYAVLEEASALLAESQHKAEAAQIVTRLGKRGRKRGISLAPVTPVPSLDEIDSQVFRSMMRMGNVVCFRTGDQVTHGMLGLQVDPSLLPEYFEDGTPTHGLCYIKGPDGRQAKVRSLNVPKERKQAIVDAAVEFPMDKSSACVFQAAWNAPLAPAGSQASPPGTAGAAPGGELQEMRQKRTTAAAAALKFLADGQPRTRADVMAAIRDVTTSPSTVGYALQTLVADGLVHTAGDKQPYAITEKGREHLRDQASVA